jgi:NADPH-dependent curcumin reductase CurA
MRRLQVVLACRPEGEPKESDFRLVENEVPEPADGQLLVHNLWLSLDPYMRMRMNPARSYADPVELGLVMVGGTVGEVVASRNPAFAAGDIVLGYLGWQTHALSDGSTLRRVDPSTVPIRAYLGAVGMPGVTAHVGLLDIGVPKPGETVVVSAAAGAVGSLVGQIGRMKGCRVVGIAGGRPKCDIVVRELGFDACVDHRAPDLAEELRDATPNGIDVYFENVGGKVLDAVLPLMNDFGRIPLCGQVSQYNATEPYGVRHLGALLAHRVKLQGFIVGDRLERWPVALADLAGWVAEGRVKMLETIAEGLAKAPRAFIGMLRGENIGKQLVQLR